MLIRLKLIVVFMVAINNNNNNDKAFGSGVFTIFDRFYELSQATFNIIRQNFNLDYSTPIDEHVNIWCCKPTEIICVPTSHQDKLIMEKLNLENPIAFFIHGWTDSINRTWVKDIIMDMAKYTNINVCAVDWSYLALVDYILAAKNTNRVAEILAKFIAYISDTLDYDLNDITLIGHSMGGQIAGLTGQMFNGQIGQIIALDPAGWLYTKPNVLHPTERLSYTSAKFVQCLHTNNDYFGFGTTFDDCHQDYYPNNGISPQPGCTEVILNEDVPYSVPFICSHFKAVQYFQASLNPFNKFIGTECRFGHKFWEMGLCVNNKNDVFGLYAKRTALGYLYLNTTINPPYI